MSLHLISITSLLSSTLCLITAAVSSLSTYFISWIMFPPLVSNILPYSGFPDNVLAGQNSPLNILDVNESLLLLFFFCFNVISECSFLYLSWHIIGGAPAHGWCDLGEGAGVWRQFVLDISSGARHQLPQEPANLATTQKLFKVVVSGLQSPLAKHVTDHRHLDNIFSTLSFTNSFYMQLWIIKVSELTELKLSWLSVLFQISECLCYKIMSNLCLLQMIQTRQSCMDQLILSLKSRNLSYIDYINSNSAHGEVVHLQKLQRLSFFALSYCWNNLK